MITELWKKFKDRSKWSWEGWTMVWREESSLKQWVVINLISLTFMLILDLSGGERALLVALGILLLAAECYNTAIERCIDYISTDIHPMAKAAKDAGSAGVAVTGVAGLAAWVMILIG